MTDKKPVAVYQLGKAKFAMEHTGHGNIDIYRWNRGRWIPIHENLERSVDAQATIFFELVTKRSNISLRELHKGHIYDRKA